MNDKKINEFFQEHGSKFGSNVIYFNLSYFGDDFYSALKDLFTAFQIVYFDLEKPKVTILPTEPLNPSLCIGVSLENLAEWKYCASVLTDSNFDILSYGIEETEE